MGVSAETCRWTYPVVTWLIMPSIALAEGEGLTMPLCRPVSHFRRFTVILMIRTWAIWHRDRKVGAALLVALIGTLFTACYCNVKFLKAFKRTLFLFFSPVSRLNLHSLGPSIPHISWMFCDWCLRHHEDCVHLPDRARVPSVLHLIRV